MNQRTMAVLEPHTVAAGANGGFSPAEGPRTPQHTPTQSALWRILIVESNSAEAETLARGLRRHGHEVDIVGTGGEALRSYVDADLVLLDLELPDLDGLEVCRGIRAAHEIP